MSNSEPTKVSRRSRSEATSIAPSEFTYEAGVPTVTLWKRTLKSVAHFVQRNLFTVVPFLILLIALGYYYYQYHHVLAQNSPAVQTKEQTQKAVADVEKLMYIKDDSGAQLAMITDTSKLTGQNFFANAKNGDELVLFPASKQAILYRPSISKIIEVGPFSPQAAPSNSVRTTPVSVFKSSSTTASTTKK